MAAAGVAAVLGIAGAFALLAMTAGNGTALEAVHGEGTDGDPAGGLDATSSLPLPSGIAPTVTPLPSDQPVATDDPLPPAIATTSTASASSPSPTSSSSSTAPAATTSTTSTSSSPTTSDGLLPLPTLPILG